MVAKLQLFKALLKRIARGFGETVRNITAPPSDLMADAGDTLLDELNAVRLRRKILAGSAGRMAGARNDKPMRGLRCRSGDSGTKLDRYYSRAHSIGDLSALCLSGGGIRSAAFALGIVQGLAKRGLLKQFDYLSTVSGGGYLGSFLTAWVQRRGYDAVCDDLLGKFKATAGSPLKYLRRYTSYLTPSRGLFTADSLTIAALYLRNLFLNWLIVIPLVLTLIIAVKSYAVVVWTLPASITTATALLMLAVSAGGMATLESLRQRPGWETHPGSSSQFQYGVKWTLFAGSMLLSVAAANYLEFLNQLPSETYDSAIYEPRSFLGDFEIGAGEPTPAHEALRPPIPDGFHVFVFPAAMFAVINFVAWMIAFFMSASPSPDEISTRSTVRTSGWNALFNLISFTFAGAVAGGLIGVTFYFAAHLFWWFDFAVLIIICAGPLAVAGAVFVGEAVHLGLTSYLEWSDGEREWLATAVGYHTRAAVSWFLLTFCVFGGSYLVFTFYREFGFSRQLASLGTTGGIAGVIVAWLGKASATAATIRERYDTWTNWSAGIVLSVAMPLFVFIAVAFLSAGVNAAVIGRTLTYSTTANISRHSLFDGIFPLEPGEINTTLLAKLATIFAVCLVLWVVASRVIATNQFSLHGLYCNRLIRAFLGGSRNPNDRRPNALSQFDEHDNFDLSELWPNKRTGGNTPPQLLVINCALNVLRSENLAWQERKALSLTCTPRAVGAYALNNWNGCYRRASEYAEGLSLGTAMTISGAAVSPSMGYHSSPALSVLMTFFNVRLGAWLGNPGPAGANVYRDAGPRFSAIPLIQEALGLATESREYVYLSDGGHFENLGLYEMVQRRCRFIVLSDAGFDPDMTFEDLGNAVRKISIDLNVRIDFDVLNIPPRKTPPLAGSYVAVAKIFYPEPGAPVGHLLYVKPSYRATEPASVRSYAEANPKFPHEPTTDQMFGESQFEAYRALGEYIMETIDGDANWEYDDIASFVQAVSSYQTRVK